MKYKTIGAFKNVQNVPYCKAVTDLRNGMGVVLDRATKTAALPADADACKGVTHIVTNIDDKPERHNSAETSIVHKGEYVRADDLRTVSGLEAEFAAAELKDGTDGLASGDMLVFGTDGLLAKVADATGYAVSFQFLKKTSYMGDGIIAVICA